MAPFRRILMLMAGACGTCALGADASAQIAGLHNVLAKPGIHFLILGELHGTEETPRFFAFVVRHLASRMPIVVSLEVPERDDAVLQSFLSSDGGPAARDALLASGMWRSPVQDGRSSQAMLRLVDDLRQLKAQRPRLRVVSCQPSGGSDPAKYEIRMAQCWMNAQRRERGTLIALVGDAHASRTNVFGYSPAAASLPPAEALTLKGRRLTGTAWNCDVGGACGPQVIAYSDAGGRRQPAISLAPYRFGPASYDGSYIPGPRFSASRPAVE